MLPKNWLVDLYAIADRDKQIREIIKRVYHHEGECFRYMNKFATFPAKVKKPEKLQNDHHDIYAAIGRHIPKTPLMGVLYSVLRYSERMLKLTDLSDEVLNAFKEENSHDMYSALRMAQLWGKLKSYNSIYGLMTTILTDRLETKCLPVYDCTLGISTPDCIKHHFLAPQQVT